MKICDLGYITLFIQVIEQHKDPNRTIHEATNNAQQRLIFAVRFTRVLTVVHNFMASNIWTNFEILVHISTIFFKKVHIFPKIETMPSKLPILSEKVTFAADNVRIKYDWH